MRKYSIIIFILLFLKANSVFANPVNNYSDITASVNGDDLYTPNLISPPNDHASNSARFTFVWRRPSPLPSTTLDHYDLFIDNAIFAAGVPDSLTAQDFYFYTATGSSGLFYIGLKQDLAQGYHTWRVAVYDNIGRNAVTGDWNFYIDSIAPFISLEEIDNVGYSWNTGNPSSIPAESSRYITIDNDNPTLNGNVEINSNLQISLLCPILPPSGCITQSWIINSPDGKWEKQLTNLIPNIYYTVNLSATDATNNSTIFPVFYLRNSTATEVSPTEEITPTEAVEPPPEPTPEEETAPEIPEFSEEEFPEELPPEYDSNGQLITPTQSQLPQISSKLTPPSGLSALLTPTSFIPRVPPAPSLPPRKPLNLKVSEGYGFIILFFFLCLGLPTHIAMSSFATGVSFKNIVSFIFTLGFPFLRRKNTSTIPFSFVEVYDPNRLNKCLYKAISDINGAIYFPQRLPSQVLITLNNTNFTWKNQIFPGLLLPHTCLLPYPKRFLGTKESLQNNFYNTRLIPLIIAILSSSIGLYFYPSAYLASYLYLSLQFSFSEYIYPTRSK